jgi:hypothetical protein
MILISLAFVDIAFGTNTDMSTPEVEFNFDEQRTELILFTDIYEAQASRDASAYPHMDFDCDGLTNIEEKKIGTDPLLADTDDDFVLDGIEVKMGTSPTSWDTDGDRLADYIELDSMATNKATDPFTADSDHDGLPDPWEDNDGDTILNIEEQHPKFKYGILGTNPNLVDSDGDTISDPDEAQVNGPGPISENAEKIAGRTQLTVTPDRTNAHLDVSNTGSFLSKHLKTLGWSDSDLAYWDKGLEMAYEHDLVAVNQSCTVWYHYTPYLWDMPTEYDWNTSPPYVWNKYDTNPASNDTDGDIMDDDWDPRPLVPDDRLDTYMAITNINYQGTNYPAEYPTNKNFTGAFKANFTSLEVKKGDQITLTMWLGLEESHHTSDHVTKNHWKPINISVSFGIFMLGSDNVSHGDISGDDIRGDDIWPDVNNTGLPAIQDKPWVAVSSTNYKGDYTFYNSSGMSSTMSFYEQIINIYLPADLPAGIVGFIARANPNTGENFWYETYRWPFIGY